MLQFIFYFFGIIAIIYEVWAIMNVDRNMAFSDKAKRGIKDESIKFSIEEYFYSFCHIGYFVWTFVGLFSSQWPCFLVIIILSSIRVVPFLRKSKIWFMFESLICIVVIMFAIINTYHLHIPYMNLFK